MSAPGYYDSETARDLAHYSFGSSRVEGAIRHALTWLPVSAHRILDVGCGIGWSSAEIRRFAPRALVLGIDVDPKRIALARRLFPIAGLSFECRSIADISPEDACFDTVVMLDVYKYVPRDQRQSFHRLLGKSMSPDAVLILSSPTLNLTDDDLQIAAEELSGAVVYTRNVPVEQSVCLHAVIRRGSQEGTRSNKRGTTAKLEPQRARYHRVSATTAHRITRAGAMLPNEAGPKICVVQPDASSYSETFIRNHLERMPARVSMLYGFPFPDKCDDESRLVPFPVIAITKVSHSLPEFIVAAADRFKNSRLTAFLKRNGIQAVLAEYGTTGAAVAASCIKAGVPIVVHFHGYDAYVRDTLEQHEAAYRKMFAAASALIAVSKDMKQQLMRIGAPCEKVHHIPYGVDTSLFAQGNPGSAPPVFVAVGRFVDKKAPHLTLVAFAKTAARVPAARLVMIGDGLLMETSQQLSRSLHVTDRVEFMGPRRPDEVAATLRGARAMVQHSVTTSYGDSEGTPNSVLEAGATGLPVIATRHAGIKDVVRENETGLLVDEGDTDSMAEHMIRLAEDPGLAASMGARARQHITANFSLDQGIKRLWEVIDQAVRAGKIRDRAS